MEDPSLLRRALASVDEVIQDLESAKIAFVSEEARSFLENVVRETIRVRMDESGRLNLTSSKEPDELIYALKNRISTVLNEASKLQQYETRPPEHVISLISIIEYTSRDWCNIWPFCR